LLVHDGELVAVGSFATAGNTAAANIARWNGTRWAPLGEGTDFDVLGRWPLYEGDRSPQEISMRQAAWPPTGSPGGTVNSWSPLGSGLNDAVGTLHVHGGELIAGGRFSWPVG
jgi:hypothetical protein